MSTNRYNFKPTLQLKFGDHSNSGAGMPIASE